MAVIVAYGEPGRLGRAGAKQPGTEDGAGSMRGGKILFRPTLDPDWFCMSGYPSADFTTRVPWERRILFLKEPPMVERYGLDYVKQFGVLVSAYAIDGYPGRLVLDNPCLGWWAGRFETLPDVENYPVPEKTEKISIVVSVDKKKKPGHRKRVAFVSALMSRYGGRIDYYGHGLNPVQNKLEAIAPYKYHIALENCQVENYWTEKLADAWIGWSFPIYCGDPSISGKVPDPMGLEVIDIGDPDSAMRKIDYILSNDVYHSRLDAIAACRKWAIRKSSIHTRICEIIESSDEAVLNKPRLGQEEVIRRIILKRHTAGEVLGGAVSWCAGRFFVWNIKRMYGNITRRRGTTHEI